MVKTWSDHRWMFRIETHRSNLGFSTGSSQGHTGPALQPPGPALPTLAPLASESPHSRLSSHNQIPTALALQLKPEHVLFLLLATPFADTACSALQAQVQRSILCVVFLRHSQKGGFPEALPERGLPSTMLHNTYRWPCMGSVSPCR